MNFGQLRPRKSSHSHPSLSSRKRQEPSLKQRWDKIKKGQDGDLIWSLQHKQSMRLKPGIFGDMGAFR